MGNVESEFKYKFIFLQSMEIRADGLEGGDVAVMVVIQYDRVKFEPYVHNCDIDKKYNE